MQMTDHTTRVVCLCQGGNSRSAACGYVLKYKYGMDALAASWEKNSIETLIMLFEWADRIIIMQSPEFLQYVPEEFRSKTIAINVGPDRWFNSLHPELVTLIDNLLQPFLQPAVVFSPDSALGDLPWNVGRPPALWTPTAGQIVNVL